MLFRSHDFDLRGGVTGSGGDNGTGKVTKGFFEHEACGREMVVEGNLREVTGTETSGVETFGPSPVVIGAVFGIEDRAGRQEDALQLAEILGEQSAETGAHGLKEDKLFLLNDRDVLDVVQSAELVHIELGTVKTLFDIFGITVGLGEQLFRSEERRVGKECRL